MRKLFCIILSIVCMAIFTACTQPEIQDSSSEIIPPQSESIYNEIESTQENQPETQCTVVEISTANDLLKLSHTYGMDDKDYSKIKYILTDDIDMALLKALKRNTEELA